MPTIQIRIDEKTKKDARKIFNHLGIDFSSGVKLYLNQVIIQQGIPFPLITENGLTAEQEEEILRREKDLEEGKNSMGRMSAIDALKFLKQRYEY